MVAICGGEGAGRSRRARPGAAGSPWDRASACPMTSMSPSDMAPERGRGAQATTWNRARVPFERQQFEAGGDVPQPHGIVEARRGQGPAVGTECHVRRGVAVADQMGPTVWRRGNPTARDDRDSLPFAPPGASRTLPMPCPNTGPSARGRRSSGSRPGSQRMNSSGRSAGGRPGRRRRSVHHPRAGRPGQLEPSLKPKGALPALGPWSRPRGPSPPQERSTTASRLLSGDQEPRVAVMQLHGREARSARGVRPGRGSTIPDAASFVGVRIVTGRCNRGAVEQAGGTGRPSSGIGPPSAQLTFPRLPVWQALKKGPLPTTFATRTRRPWRRERHGGGLLPGAAGGSPREVCERNTSGSRDASWHPRGQEWPVPSAEAGRGHGAAVGREGDAPDPVPHGPVASAGQLRVSRSPIRRA